MPTPTSNPVPSKAPQDLLFNAEKVDEFVNSPAATFVNRAGEVRKTLAGIEAFASEQIDAMANTMLAQKAAQIDASAGGMLAKCSEQAVAASEAASRASDSASTAETVADRIAALEARIAALEQAQA